MSDNLASMELSSVTVLHYLEHAYGGMRMVLARLDDELVNQSPPDWGTNTVAGLVVHCCELAPSWFETPGLGRPSERDRDAEFEATATIAELNTRIDETLLRLRPLVEEFEAGPTATDHDLRVFLPGADRSDAALVIHVMEELFQHLGHMELTADALENLQRDGA